MATSAFTLLDNPAAPDLGCLVKRKHELQFEAGSANVHVEFVPSIDFQPTFLTRPIFWLSAGKRRSFNGASYS